MKVFTFWKSLAGVRPISSNERGSTLLESTMVLPLFLLILIVSFDLLRATYCHLTVQYVGREVLRQAIVGGISAANVRPTVVARARKFGVSLNANDITLCPYTQPNCGVALSTQPIMHVLQIRMSVRQFIFGRIFSEATRRTYTIDQTLVSRKEPT